MDLLQAFINIHINIKFPKTKMKNRSKKTNIQPNGKARDHKMHVPTQKRKKKGVEQSKAVQKKMALYGNLGFQIIRKS